VLVYVFNPNFWSMNEIQRFGRNMSPMQIKGPPIRVKNTKADCAVVASMLVSFLICYLRIIQDLLVIINACLD
jgi:hypothetical protein